MNITETKLLKYEMSKIEGYRVINQEEGWISVFWMLLRRKNMKIVTVITVDELMSNNIRY